MTWGEFKRRVEAAGVADTDILAHIDWWGEPGDRLGVHRIDWPGGGRFGKVIIDDIDTPISLLQLSDPV